ncbi:MAG: hypothetical protein LBH44_06050 [Treponema sp.]|jgi:hypothetical protein|nr:hypothetical protein [Treponema sp.]
MMPKAAFLYRALFAAVIIAGVVPVHAQVDQGELQQNLPPITFLNYEGPHARIDTREQIRQIGVVLGRDIANGEARMASVLAGMTVEQRRQYSYKLEAGAKNRYYVSHSISGADGRKLDSDIFGLGIDVGVDHIRNLRTIIQGYLQAAYSYTAQDASLLAEYITIYNAVYRGNWDYFTSRYKTQVIENITREKAGLSIRYDEWPGRTLIVIPLGIGGLSSVDTSAISDERVIEEMRKEDDRGIEQRRDMVDLKEREADQAEQRARTEREAIRDEEQRNTQERQEIAQERQRTQEDRDAGRITQDEARQREQDLAKREDAADRREQDTDRRRDDAQSLEDFAEKKTEEAQQDRRDIAEDQQAALIDDGQGGIIGIMIEKRDSYMGRLVRLGTDGKEIRRSPLDTVHVRTITLIGGKILAIAGENRGNGAVRLIDINRSNLEIAKQGDDDLLPGSLLWVNGNDLYAITVDLASNACYLGRFNTNLALQAKSKVQIHAQSSVTIQEGRLLTQREDGSVLILNPADLTEVRN